MHTFEQEYEWDEKKAAANLAKHGVDFADAIVAVEDERALELVDEESSEERYVLLGLDEHGRLLAVAYTWRGDVMRIISARKATTTEAQTYAGTKR